MGDRIGSLKQVVALNKRIAALEAKRREDVRRLINIGSRLAGCLWDFAEICPECGNNKSRHMLGCNKTYMQLTKPEDCELVFRAAFPECFEEST